MSTTAPPTETSRPITPALLERVATFLLAGLDPVPDAEPVVLAVGVIAGTDAGADLAFRPLDGVDPLGSLVGFDAPDDWQAMGVVATGTWFPTNELDAGPLGPRRGARRSPGGRLRMGHFVSRDAQVLAVLQKEDDETPQLHWADPAGQYGRGDDVCRRALGLATAPPARDVRELWTLVWCDVIVERVLQGSIPSWPEIAAAHPAIGRLGLVDADATAWAVDNLVRLGNEYAELYPWEELRVLCARNEWPMTGIDAPAAAWMDAGMFSRWALEPYPELFDLLEDLSVLLPPETAYRVWRTADAWSLS